MCIGLYSNVPLQIQFLQEQVWCYPQEDELRVKECYDLVLTNQGSVPTEKLMFLSPHLLFDPVTDGPQSRPAVKLPSFDDKKSKYLNWYMKHDDVILDGPFLDEKPVRFKVPAFMMPGSEPLYDEYTCTPLSGEVRLHKTLRRKFSDMWTCFLKLNCTFGEILLEDALKPYDDNCRAETTYCIRIVFEPVALNHRVAARKLSFQDNKGALWVQPCEVLAPPIVFYKLRTRLEHSVECMPVKANKVMKEDLADNGFLQDDHIVWIEDHRVSVITAENGTVMNTESLGSVLPSIVQDAGKQNLHAWTWHAGSRHFPKEDAFIVAEQTYKYFHNRVKKREDAVTKHQVANNIGFPVANVSFAVDVLKKKGLLSENKGRYHLKKEAPNETFSYASQAEIRRDMAKPQTNWLGDEIFFPGKSFLIQFAVMWSSG